MVGDIQDGWSSPAQRLTSVVKSQEPVTQLFFLGIQGDWGKMRVGDWYWRDIYTDLLF